MQELTAKIYRKIQDIPPQDWEAVFPNTQESYCFYKTIDESNFSGFSLYYIAVYENQKAVGFAPCFLMDYSFDATLGEFFGGMVRGVRKMFPGFLKMKMLMCGSVCGEGRIGIAYDKRPLVVDVIVKAMEGIAKQTKTSVITFKDFSEEYASDFTHLLNDGFCRFFSFPVAEMDIRFNSFEDYLMNLGSHSRADLRRKFRRIEKLEKVELQLTGELGEYLDRAYELYQQTLSRSDVLFEIVPKDFFRRISQNMSGEAKYFLWFINKKLVAFDLCLIKGTSLVGEYIGLDYTLAYEYHLYFLQIKDVISWCIKNGITRFYNGATDYEPKKRLGFKIKPLYIYVKHRNRLVSPAVKVVCNCISPKNFDRTLKEIK